MKEPKDLINEPVGISNDNSVDVSNKKSEEA
jgi:hypothetical protein